jgi:hypothetical protein|tara:strand:+ start:206 stop:553 length:348 start_codon:yes stop_codon:yes gene_type:complete
MKYLLILGLLIAGCQSGSPNLILLTLEEKVVGEYKSDEGSTLLLRGDNVAEISGKSTARWSIVNNEVFLDKQGLLQAYYRIQLNGDLALVAVTILGNRNDLLTKNFTLYKKVRKD